jgi:hypothetical protein
MYPVYKSKCHEAGVLFKNAYIDTPLYNLPIFV